MAGMVHIPWYATGFRGDRLGAALADISAASLRYGARSHAVHRMRDDRYKFLQVAEFESKADFERYWFGPEFTDFRILCSGWFQVPVLYGWADLVAAGELDFQPARGPESAPAVGGDLAG
jgi:hypothetical protein